MLKIIDLPAIKELLRRDGLVETLTGLGRYLREDFSRWEEFEKSARLATHYPWGVIELMPISDSRWYGFKYVNGHPGNPALGLQSVVAVGMLAEVESGYPVLLSEMTVLTALRTAATAALVASLCGRPESATMALIGAGAQSAFQVVAMAGVLPLTDLRCFDIRAEAVERLRRDLSRSGLRVRACGSIEEAVDGADVVTTATAVKTHQRLLGPQHIRPGTHINAIGGDCQGKTELDPALLGAARVIVEFAPQTRVEGELQLARPDLPVIELWELIEGRQAGRRDADEITLFDSVGFALEDFSALRYLHDRARVLNLGYASALLPEPSATQNLFAAVTADTGAPRQAPASGRVGRP